MQGFGGKNKEYYYIFDIAWQTRVVYFSVKHSYLCNK